MIAYILLFPALLALVGSAVGTGWLTRRLRAQAILDIPNARSNHKVPTPRGGGLAVVSIILIVWLLLPLLVPMVNKPVVFHGAFWLISATVLLMFVSWQDDKHGLSPKIRLAAQFLAVAMLLPQLPEPAFADWLPLPIAWAITFLGWVWFINLFNFMDGIDGISGMQTLFICLGVWGGVFISPIPDAYLLHISVLGAAIVGFLLWNWHPAKIFLGDVGSVPLGFLLGYFLIILSTSSMTAPFALLLPAYYLCDSGLTILKRLWARKNILEAHSEHAYQHAVRRGLSHGRVVVMISVLNLYLLMLCLSYRLIDVSGWALLAAGYGASLLLMAYFIYGTARSHVKIPHA